MKGGRLRQRTKKKQTQRKGGQNSPPATSVSFDVMGTSGSPVATRHNSPMEMRDVPLWSNIILVVPGFESGFSPESDSTMPYTFFFLEMFGALHSWAEIDE